MTHCINESMLEECTTNGWKLFACEENETCQWNISGDGGECIEEFPDLLALPINTGEVLSPGMPVTGEHAEVSDHNSFSVYNGGEQDDPFSVSMWIWGANLNQANTVHPLIRKGGSASETSGGSAGAEWILFMKDKRLYWIVYDAAGVAWYKRSQLVGDEMNGQWAHVVVTYLGANQGALDPHKFTKFYVNGTNVTDTSGASSGSSSATEWTYTHSINDDKELQIGFVPTPAATWSTSSMSTGRDGWSTRWPS